MANTAMAFTALADPTRRAIFERLRAGPLAVGRLSTGMAVTRPAVSQHLKVLRDAGLVVDEPQGTRRLYRIDPNGIAAMRTYLDQFWNEALSNFAAVAEEDEKNDVQG